jgi:hypothetical protein
MRLGAMEFAFANSTLLTYKVPDPGISAFIQWGKGIKPWN